LFGTHALIKSFLMVFFSCACHQHLWRSHVPNNKGRGHYQTTLRTRNWGAV